VARDAIPDGWRAAGIEIRILMADGAAHCRKAMAIRSAHDRRLVQPALVALSRTLARRMAVGATRMGQHFAEFGEHGRRPRFYIRNRRKAVGACKRMRRGLGGRVTREHAHRERGGSDEKLKPRLRFHFALPPLLVICSVRDSASNPQESHHAPPHGI
jgi:hypothetical protein